MLILGVSKWIARLFGVQDSGFRVQSLGLGFRVSGLGFRVYCLGLGFRGWSVGFGVEGLGFRVEGCRVTGLGLSVKVAHLVDGGWLRVEE